MERELPPSVRRGECMGLTAPLAPEHPANSPGHCRSEKRPATGYQDRGAPASPQVLTWSWLEMYIQAHPGLLSQTLWVARVCSHLPPGCSMAATWRSHSRLPRAPGNCPRLRVIVTPLDPPSRSSPRKVHADPMCSQGAGQACPDAVRPLSGPSMQSPSHSLAQLMGLPSW